MDPVTVQLALALVAQGMRLWADRADRLAKGAVTDEELDAMATELGKDVDDLRAEIAAARGSSPTG